MNIPFYFHVRHEFHEVESLFRGYHSCRYTAGRSKGGLFSPWAYDIYYRGELTSIPRDLVTGKKYLGVIVLNYNIHPDCLPFDLYTELANIGVEVIDKNKHNPARVRPEAESIDLLFQNLLQFSSFCRELDLAIGGGKWSIKQSNARGKVSAAERILEPLPSFISFRRRGAPFRVQTCSKIKDQGGVYLTFMIPKSFGIHKIMKLMFLSNLKLV